MPLEPKDAPLVIWGAGAIGGTIGAEKAETWRAARREAHTVTIGHRDMLALPT